MLSTFLQLDDCGQGNGDKKDPQSQFSNWLMTVVTAQ